MPHIWNWDGKDEIAFFTKNHNILLMKEDMDFWKLDVYLDENGYYKKHTIKKYSDYPFMHLLYSQLLVCQRVCLQNTVCLICK